MKKYNGLRRFSHLKKSRWLMTSVLSVSAIGVILSFQNCSRAQVHSMARGSRVVLSEQSVFGDRASVSASSDSAAQSLAVDGRGRPVIRLPDVPMESNACVNCTEFLITQGLPPETPVAPCERVICDGDTSRKPSECEEGTTFVGGSCIPQCPQGQIFINGECASRTQSCVIEGGTGIQYWASNSFGACLARTCDTTRGFRRDGNRCVPICVTDEVFYENSCHKRTQACSITHGSGQQVWMGSSYGSCLPVACQPGYQISGSACTSICTDNQSFYNGICHVNTQSCPVANGSGQQTWAGTDYGPCLVTSCSEGFITSGTACVSRCTGDQVYANGQCNPRTRPCSILHGVGEQTWSGSSYGSCQVLSCDASTGYVKVGEVCNFSCTSEQVFENGACKPLAISCPITNGTGVLITGQKKVIGTNAHGGDWGSQQTCQRTSCNPGYKAWGNLCISTCNSTQVVINGTCAPSVVSCPIEHGTGQMMWAGSSYGPCGLLTCDAGFVAEGNFCRGQTDEERAASEAPWWSFVSGDPLIVDLGNEGKKISLSSQFMGTLFDLLGSFATPTQNSKVLVSWTKNPRYRYLALPNARGEITGIDQLFGDKTKGPDGQGARDGFMALKKFDGMDVAGTVRLHDADGFIDEKDKIFSKLTLWADLNGNGVADPGETESLTDMGVESIDLKYDGNFYEVDKWGNQTVFKSVVKFKDGRETLIFDLWFRYFVPVRPGCYTF